MKAFFQRLPTVFQNLKKNIGLLLSVLAGLCLYLSPSKAGLYDTAMRGLVIAVIASCKPLRLKGLRRPARLLAAVPTALILVNGYCLFTAEWVTSSKAAALASIWGLSVDSFVSLVGLLGCAAGCYAGLVLFGHFFSLLLSAPSLIAKGRAFLHRAAEAPASNAAFLAPKENIRREILCFVLCVAIIAPLLIVGIYNRQSADDYSYAIYTHQAALNGEGFWGVLKAAWKTNIEYYFTWQGLYSSAFLLSLQPAIFGEKLYALTTPILLIWAYVFVYLSVQIINKAYLRRSRFFSATASLVVVTMVALWLPSATEGLYWFNGAVNYMPWAFTNLFNLCYLASMGKRLHTARGKAALGISTALSFLTSGGNHVTAFGNILLLLLLSAFLIPRKKFYPLLPLAAACIGFVIMYVAPGTAIRQAYCEKQTVMGTIGAVIVYLFTDVIKWLDVQWLLSLLVITPIGLEIAHKNQFKLPKYFALVSIVLSIGVICGMLAVPYYPIGNFGAGRSTNVIWITFLFLSWYNYIVVLITLANHGVFAACGAWLQKIYQPLTSLLMVGCLALLMIFPSRNGFSNSMRAVRELASGQPRVYAEEWDRRAAALNDPTQTEVYVPALSNRSDLLFFSDLFIGDSLTSSSWVDRYYGKKVYMLRE